MSNKNLAAIFIGIAMAVWLFSGSVSFNSLTAELDTQSIPEIADPLVRAQFSRSLIQNMVMEVTGVTQPNREVEVRFEISGKVEAIAGLKGTKVQAGDLLCQIAVDTRESELSEASSELRRAELEFKGVRDLGKQGLQSNINIAKSRASLESSRARLKKAELALQKTSVTAPFAGVVSSQPVEIGGFMTPGSVCVSLMEVDPILVVGHVAEKNIGTVTLGDKVEVSLITNQQLVGTVSYIAYAPDNNTRSYPIEVTVDNPEGKIRSGLTSKMQVPLGAQEAHLISPASLVLNDTGDIGVRLVNQQSLVQFYPVLILKEAKSGIWVGGLPKEIKLITIGQEEVFDGQRVRVDLTSLTISDNANPDKVAKQTSNRP